MRASKTMRRNQRWGVEPTQYEHVEQTEGDKARQAMRDWLRDRDETNAPEWEEETTV